MHCPRDNLALNRDNARTSHETYVYGRDTGSRNLKPSCWVIDPNIRWNHRRNMSNDRRSCFKIARVECDSLARSYQSAWNRGKQPPHTIGSADRLALVSHVSSELEWHYPTFDGWQRHHFDEIESFCDIFYSNVSMFQANSEPVSQLVTADNGDNLMQRWWNAPRSVDNSTGLQTSHAETSEST